MTSQDLVRGVDSLPKVSLHCHLEGTLRPATFRRLALRHGVKLERSLDVPDDKLYAFESFYGFLMLFRDAALVLRTPEDFALLAREFAAYATEQQIRYAETFVAPSVWTRVHPHIDVEAVFRAIRRELDEAFIRDGIVVRLICDLTRNFGVASVRRGLEIATAMRSYGVIGVGLGGDEKNFPARLFEGVFDRARALGLRITVHAGESDGPASVRDAVERLGAERIGHGVRAVADPRVMRLLAERRVTLEQSPGSNRRTGVWLEASPMRRFVNAGVRVAVDADDPGLFRTTISGEMDDLAREFGDAFVIARLRDAIEGAFSAEGLKQNLRDELERSVAEMRDVASRAT